MYATNKISSLKVISAIFFILSTATLIQNENNIPQIFGPKCPPIIHTHSNLPNLEVIDDDKYEIQIKSSEAPFQDISGNGFIFHGFENALRKNNFKIKDQCPSVK